MQKEIIFRDGQSACWLVRGAFEKQSLEKWNGRIHWQHNAIRLYGKEHMEPRLTAWMGPAYRYASVQWPSTPFSKDGDALRDAVTALCRPPVPFNACLFNLYRNGTDSMGWHRDNEPEIDPRMIASLSFGATRDFVIRHRVSKEKWTISLRHGDLLVMSNLQEMHEHALPKRLRVEGPRLNMTFRHIAH